ncbi:MAG: terminase family protein [Pseudomonadota bacterium]
MSATEQDDLREYLHLLEEITRRQNGNKLASYRPYEKQRDFHRLGATKRERLLRAGNQNGKTFSVGSEVAYHLTGLYPDWWDGRRWERPVMVWASSETAESTRDNPQRALIGIVGEHGTGSIPAAELGIDMGMYGRASGTADLYDYVKVRHYTHGVFDGWSTLRFKYYAQGRRKWQGPPVDFVWFDEEPPEDIYDEGLARTIATGGCAAMSFTPLLGMSTVVKRFLLEKSEDRSDTNMTIEDAEHIPQAERDKIIASFPAHERRARAMGIPILGEGLIFPVDEDTIKCEPFSLPDIWPRVAALDIGWDHFAAQAWLAWDRDNDIIYVYDAVRVRHETPTQQAPAILARGPWIPMAWPADGLQTEKGTGIAMAAQYRAAGVNMLYEHAQLPETDDEGESRVSRTSVEAGVALMLDRMLTGRFKVFSNIHSFFDEIRLFHRKDGKIVKLDDDLISAVRYGVVSLRFAICPPDPTPAVKIDRPYNWRAG